MQMSHNSDILLTAYASERKKNQIDSSYVCILSHNFDTCDVMYETQILFTRLLVDILFAVMDTTQYARLVEADYLRRQILCLCRELQCTDSHW